MDHLRVVSKRGHTGVDGSCAPVSSTDAVVSCARSSAAAVGEAVQQELHTQCACPSKKTARHVANSSVSSVRGASWLNRVDYGGITANLGNISGVPRRGIRDTVPISPRAVEVHLY